MKKINLFIAATLIGIAIYSCDSRTYKEIEDQNIVAPTNPTYNADVKRIIDDKCISCHSYNATDNQEPYLETYNEVKNACEAPGNKNLICRIEFKANSEQLKSVFISLSNSESECTLKPT